jgi:hypothetical protein
MVQSLNPCRDKRIFSSPKCPDRLWGLHSLLFNGHRASIPGGERPGHEVYPSPLSHTEATNEWSYTSIPSTCLNGVERNKKFTLFTFTVFINFFNQS